MAARFDNRVGKVRVPVYRLAGEIHAEGQFLADIMGQDDPNEEPYTDCRLQVHEGSWCLHTGDPGYDQDHRGYWGSSSIPRGCSKARAVDIAKELIEQAGDDAAMCGEKGED